MIDVGPELQRVRDQLHPAPGAFMRVMERRQRRRRNQRIAAALFSLTVAAASFGLVARAFLLDREPIRVGTTPVPGPPAVLPKLTATLPIGSEGGGSVLFAEGSVWVTASAKDGSGAGHVVRVDPATNVVIARIPVPAVPGWVAGGGGIGAGAGSIWVTGGGWLSGRWAALLIRIDPISNDVVATIPLDDGEWSTGQDVSVGAGGVWVVYSASDAESSRDMVARIDPSTNEVTARIALELEWAHWILATEDRVVVLEHRTFHGGERAGVFTVIDPATNQIVASAEPQLPGTAWGLVAWDGQVWTNAGGLVEIDPSSGEAIGQSVRSLLAISSEGVAAGEGGIWFVAYNPNASNERPVTVNRLNPTAGQIDVSAEVREARGVAIAVGAGIVWILDYAGNLLRVDLVPASTVETKPLVAPFAAGFLQSRIDGSGAGTYLSSAGAEEWSSQATGLGALYSPADLRYESFAIVSVQDLGDGTYGVGVRMFGAHLDGRDEWFTEPLFEETLIVGPGEDPSGEQRPLVINGARPGISGP